MDNLPDRSTLRNWFALGLRLLGFWEILTTGSYFIMGLNISMKLTRPYTYSFGSEMTHVFGHLILALWLIKWAPNIARFVYPEPPPKKNDSAAKGSDSWFAFGLRLLGFWEILSAGTHFIYGLNISMGFTKPVSDSYSFGSEMTHVFGHLILALWLIKWAPNITRFISPDPPPKKNDSAAKSAESAIPSI